MLATVAAAKVQKKKYSVSIYSEAEPHAMYAIYKQTRKLCVLQYSAYLDIYYPGVSAAASNCAFIMSNLCRHKEIFSYPHSCLYDER